MSLAIDVDAVTAVLLADGWHPVHEQSFDVDSYEFVGPHPDQDHNFVLLAGGQENLIPARGFSFYEAREDLGQIVAIYGPLTAILAVRCVYLEGKT